MNDNGSSQISVKSLKLRIRNEIGTALVLFGFIPSFIAYLFFKDTLIGLLLEIFEMPIAIFILYETKLKVTRKYITKENHGEVLKVAIPELILLYIFAGGSMVISRAISLISLIVLIFLISPGKEN